MTDFFKIKKRGRRGEGRAVQFKALMLPVDIIDELKLYKDYYSVVESTSKDEWGNPIPARVSFEQMLRFWMDNVSSFDPRAFEHVQSMKDFREKHPGPKLYDVNPFDYPVDQFQYYFDTDDGPVDAEFNGETFVCTEDFMDYKGMTLDEMYNQNWPLGNDGSVVFSLEQAHELCRRMKRLESRKAKKEKQ